MANYKFDWMFRGFDKAQHIANNETNRVDNDMTACVGKHVLIDGDSEIQWQSGGSVIKISPSGIDIASSDP